MTAFIVLLQQLASDINKLRREYNYLGAIAGGDDYDYFVGDRSQEEFRRWLSPPDPSINHNIAWKAHHKGSAEWFIHGNTYRQWKMSTGSLLWIHGKRMYIPFFLTHFPNEEPILQQDPERAFFRMHRFTFSLLKRLTSSISSTIIEDCNGVRKAGLARMGFFFFDFKDQSKQNVRGALSSLLIQLAAQSDAYCESLSALYSEYDAGSRQPSEYALRECLENILMLQNQGPIFIIIDAIDECPNNTDTPSPRENVLELVEWLSELQYSHVSICVTSRPEADIEAVLQPLASHTVSVHGESGQKEDIINFITWFMDSDPKARKWRKEDKELVVKKLSERADGM